MTRPPLAVFGLETRYVARLYALRTALVVALALALVLALDLAGHYDRVLTAQGVAAMPEGAPRLAWYLWLRALYNLPAILPIGMGIGIVWVEFDLTRGHERAMIANTGRAPLLSLMPALVVGVAFGLAQVALLAHVRPHAVKAQGEAGFRYYGAGFAGGSAPPEWHDFGAALVHAGLRFEATGPVLVDLRLFLLDGENRLERVIWADEARPVDGAVLLAGAHATWPTEGLSDARVPLAINTDWLAHAGVEPRLLPQGALTRIAHAASGVPAANAYRAALNERHAALAAMVAMALLVASLSLRWLAARRGLMAPLVILGAAYALNLGGNVFSALGEYGRIAPVWAAWGLPVAVLGGCALVLGIGGWRMRRRLRASGG